MDHQCGAAAILCYRGLSNSHYRRVDEAGDDGGGDYYHSPLYKNNRRHRHYARIQVLGIGAFVETLLRHHRPWNHGQSVVVSTLCRVCQIPFGTEAVQVLVAP